MLINDVKLTQFSHGAGCGCKIAPAILDKILHSNFQPTPDARLLVGNDSRDDAAVYDLGNGTALISTTDFFMPIVDDAYDFGRIASANAISDVYAMGGSPTVAIAILGWPVGKIPEEVAARVLEGSRAVCREAGIILAGGHSIDSPEPIFGLAVTGLVDIAHLKQNNSAKAGDLLYLTKPIGIGAISTAQKKGIVTPEDLAAIVKLMTTLNKPGQALGKMEYVHALTDVTGFGLLGHLGEMCTGSGLAAEIEFDAVPRISGVEAYIAKGSIPGGTKRNWASYGHLVEELDEASRYLLCDPQTSGGLLIAVDPAHQAEFEAQALETVAPMRPIGRMLTEPGKIRII
ncbi:MAG TPA: selenide, water dikinase SelD [Bacteroidetes bacterium]|nr:selenide, water dikinase SelD [Bacteroidota bacterium]